MYNEQCYFTVMISKKNTNSCDEETEESRCIQELLHDELVFEAILLPEKLTFFKNYRVYLELFRTLSLSSSLLFGSNLYNYGYGERLRPKF